MTEQPPPLRDRFLDLLGGAEMMLPLGWETLFIRTLEAISALPPEERAGLRFVQVKEKMGGLRASHRGGGPEASALIRAAEEESLHVCDRCGAPGSLRCRDGNWATLCDHHAEKDGF